MALTDYLPKALRPRVSVAQVVAATAPVPKQRITVETDEEHGTSGTENYGGYIRREDYNPQFDDFTQAVKIYEEMRRTDAQIRSMLQVMKLPLRGATWTATPPPGGDPVDQKIADFINETIFDDDAMAQPWDFVLRHILTQLDYGFSVLEVIYCVDEEGYYRVKKLAPRLARTIKEWHVNRAGELVAVIQYAAVPEDPKPTLSLASPTRPRFAFTLPGSRDARIPAPSTTTFKELFIPAKYLVVCTNDREGDNFAGVSLLRTVYRNWWYKNEAYKQEGVALDRYAVGIPVAELEEGHTLQRGDLASIRELLKGIRSNERSYIITPPHVKLKILPEGGMGGARSNSNSWIDHHDTQIARNILAGFLTMGSAPLGTLGFGARLTDMFISSLAGVAKGIAGDLKRQLVRPLCDLNFNMRGRQYPSVVVRDLENVDLTQIVDVFGKLTNTVLTPTDDDEAMLRKILGMPPLPPDSTREAAKEAGASPMAPPPGGQPAPGQPPLPQQGAPGGGPTPEEGGPLPPEGAGA